MKHYPKNPCLAPLTSVQISPQGHLTPCCWYYGKENKSEFNITDTTIQEYREHFLFPMYEKMKNNEYHDGCSKCLTNGKTRIKYYEELYAHKRKEIEKNKNIKTLDLRLGNLCNISCITCNSYNSDYFHKVKSQGYYLWDYQTRTKSGQNWAENTEIMDDIKRHLVNVDHLYFTGGEPTINTGMKKILQHLIDINKTDVTIEINTNLTNANTEFMNLIRNFKWRISMSVDAVGELNDVIRYPSKFTMIEKNIQTYLDMATPNDRLAFVPTISIFNFFKLPKILKWMEQYCNKYPHLNFYTAKQLNILHQPEWMNVANIPKELYYEQVNKIPSPFDAELKNKIYTAPYIIATDTNSMFSEWSWNKILEETRKYFESRGYDPKITGIPGI